MSNEFFRNQTDPIYVPEDGPGAAEAPYRGLYQIMGEDNIKALLRDFYFKLGESPISGMFPKDLEKASFKSALFFIGLLGGPPLYHETFGPPRMRARHMPFKITAEFREVWLSSFYSVLENYENYAIPSEHLAGFKAFLDGFSAWMVNSSSNSNS
jgi:hemoglobin